MSVIFLSYASTDREVARRVATALASDGVTVWWDRSIAPGQRFARVIADQLNASQCVVALWSVSSIESDWVIDEATEGKRRSILVPALIDSVELPIGFRQIQTANLIEWLRSNDDSGLRELLAAVRPFVLRDQATQQQPATSQLHIAGLREPEHSSNSDGKRSLFRSWRPRAIYVGAVGTLALLLGIAYLLRPRETALPTVDAQVQDKNQGTPLQLDSRITSSAPSEFTTPSIGPQATTKEAVIIPGTASNASPRADSAPKPKISSPQDKVNATVIARRDANAETKMTSLTYHAARRLIDIRDVNGAPYICDHPLDITVTYLYRVDKPNHGSSGTVLGSCVTEDAGVGAQIDSAISAWNRSTPTFGPDWVAPNNSQLDNALTACMRKGSSAGVASGERMWGSIRSDNSELVAHGKYCADKETGKRNSTDDPYRLLVRR